MCFLTGLYKLYYNTRILSLFANQDRYLAFLQKNNYVFELLLQLTILQIAGWFFTSIPLVQCLENYGIYACGTIKANRRGFPTELKNPNLERGDAKQVQHENMVITVWNDNKPVRFCLSLYILYQYIFDQFFYLNSLCNCLLCRGF